MSIQLFTSQEDQTATMYTFILYLSDVFNIPLRTIELHFQEFTRVENEDIVDFYCRDRGTELAVESLKLVGKWLNLPEDGEVVYSILCRQQARFKLQLLLEPTTEFRLKPIHLQHNPFYFEAHHSLWISFQQILEFQSRIIILLNSIINRTHLITLIIKWNDGWTPAWRMIATIFEEDVDIDECVRSLILIGRINNLQVHREERIDTVDEQMLRYVHYCLRRPDGTIGEILVQNNKKGGFCLFTSQEDQMATMYTFILYLSDVFNVPLLTIELHFQEFTRVENEDIIDFYCRDRETVSAVRSLRLVGKRSNTPEDDKVVDSILCRQQARYKLQLLFEPTPEFKLKPIYLQHNPMSFEAHHSHYISFEEILECKSSIIRLSHSILNSTHFKWFIENWNDGWTPPWKMILTDYSEDIDIDDCVNSLILIERNSKLQVRREEKIFNDHHGVSHNIYYCICRPDGTVGEFLVENNNIGLFRVSCEAERNSPSYPTSWDDWIQAHSAPTNIGIWSNTLRISLAQDHPVATGNFVKYFGTIIPNIIENPKTPILRERAMSTVWRFETATPTTIAIEKARTPPTSGSGIVERRAPILDSSHFEKREPELNEPFDRCDDDGVIVGELFDFWHVCFDEKSSHEDVVASDRTFS
ncbi:hypothetical protein GCK72_017609 [Caenorhabditis remanei]|uniref:Uncharacterized protein n=1 Tax=Caenorhabditis remanei TaxID=31234 RepID=A0A6A5G7R8_CAERE|nr:hypothetical protein GCK72_017609 [Caenorhabditis remanei]KAF1751057.1 hypothetical protein GCK72_017609 [Caenorhabditis remanei]